MGKGGALGLRDRRGAACCAPTMCMLRPYRVPPRLPRCLGRRGEVQNAARPRVPFGRPAIGPSAVRCPSACTRNAWIAWAPPVCSTYRYRLSWLSAMSLMPAPINAVPPFASTRPIAPSGAIAKADTEAAPVGTERHLRRSHVRAREGSRGARDRRESTARPEREAGDVARASRIQDIEHVAVYRQADRQRAARRGAAREGEAPPGAHAEHRHVVGAGVDGEQPAAVLAQGDGALRAEARAGARA